MNLLSIEDRLQHYSLPMGGHFLWCGTSNRGGYGKISVNGKVVQTHRAVWELEYGPIPAGVNVLHLCNNPPCIDPRHLYLGTEFDNMQDVLRAGNHHYTNMTQCPQGHPYDRDNTNLYRGRRYCRACNGRVNPKRLGAE